MNMKKSEITFLLKNTRFDEQEITEFYRCLELQSQLINKSKHFIFHIIGILIMIVPMENFGGKKYKKCMR